MDPKTNLNNLSDIVCDKDLVVEKKTLKVKTGEADKENTFLRGEVTDLTVLWMQRFKPLFLILKYIRKNACYKKTLIYMYNLNPVL